MIFQIWSVLLIGVLVLPGTKAVLESINHNVFHRVPTPVEVLIAWLAVMILFLLAIVGQA